MYISEDEGEILLKEFINNNNNSVLLSKENIIEFSKMPFPGLKFSWNGLSNEDIHDVNPFPALKRISVDKLNNISFGFKNGLVFLKNTFYFVKFEVLKNQILIDKVGPISIEKFGEATFGKFNEKKGEGLYYRLYLDHYNETKQRKYSESEYKILIELKDTINDFIKIKIKNSEHLKEVEEQKKLKALSELKANIYSEFDKDNDGKIDLIENDFNKLLNKSQKTIIDIDRNYIHQFVKISNYIKTKRNNLQLIFESISLTKNEEELKNQIDLVKNQIHTYELLIFHSVNMIGAIVAENMIVFYEIFESFDKLGMFNSNWENEVSNKLTNIGDKLDDLMYAIESMEQNIVSELSHLSYVTQESFADLNASVTKQLQDVESSINLNNLLTGIQAYQMYRINQNTKRIN
jgi:hypothetical protein